MLAGLHDRSSLGMNVILAASAAVWVEAAGAAVTPLVIVGSALAIMEQRRGSRAENLFALINFLQEERTREARRAVIAAAESGAAPPESAVSQVASSYDVAGRMLEKRYVDGQVILEAYGASIRKCYEALEPQILSRRKAHRDESYWEGFTRLFCAAGGNAGGSGAGAAVSSMTEPNGSLLASAEALIGQNSMERQSTSEHRQVQLVEYQKAQDSAEHHDGLFWTVTSLNWVGSAVLMGFVLGALGSHPSPSHRAALVAISLVGILLSLFVWRWARQFRALKKAKYRRCQEIERQLTEAGFEMRQHTQVVWPPQEVERSRSYPRLVPNWLAGVVSRRSKRLQSADYSILMCVFLGAWAYLLAAISLA